VERLLREGGGADRQRAAHAAGGMPGLLRHLAAETAAPL
jgi:glutamate---cysteine ligase / carboxylate-amine ligase